VIRDITGRQNHSVKLARKLQKKKHRRERGLLVGEGMDLLRAAVDAGADVRDILVRQELVDDLPSRLRERAAVSECADATGVDIGVCDEETLVYASSLGGSADVIFICPEPAWSLSDLDLGEGVTLFLDGVGDPGNVGTLVRSCAAFGAIGVMCSPGTADPYGPKALRGGMGAQFSVPIVTEVTPGDLKARLSSLSTAGDSVPSILVADPHEGDDLRALRPRPGAGSSGDGSHGGAGGRGLMVVLGAERSGAGEEWASERRVTIRQSRFDSLNVAMAGTILLYELCREE
jgi:TrmH family RNA methyltransferase